MKTHIEKVRAKEGKGSVDKSGTIKRNGWKAKQRQNVEWKREHSIPLPCIISFSSLQKDWISKGREKEMCLIRPTHFLGNITLVNLGKQVGPHFSS